MMSPRPHKRKRQHEVHVASDVDEQGDMDQLEEGEVVPSPVAKKACAEATTEPGTAGARQDDSSTPTAGQAAADGFLPISAGHPEQLQDPFTACRHEVGQSSMPATSASTSAPAPSSAPGPGPGAPKGPTIAPAPGSSASAGITTAAGPLGQLLHYLAAAAQLLVASTQSMHASSLTAEQTSGLHGLNDQLTQLVGQLDAAAGTSTAVKAGSTHGDTGAPPTVPAPPPKPARAPPAQLMYMAMHDPDCSSYCLSGTLEPHKMWFGVGVHRAIRQLVPHNNSRHSLILSLHAAGGSNGYGDLGKVYDAVKGMRNDLAAGTARNTEPGAKLLAGVEELKELLEHALRQGPGDDGYNPPAFLRA